MSDHTVYPLLSAESIETAFNLKIKGEDPPSSQLIHFFKSDGNYLIKDFWILFFKQHCECNSEAWRRAWPYQSPAEEHRLSAVVGRGPGDELLNVVQLAAGLYRPLQLVLQTLLEVLWDFLHGTTAWERNQDAGKLICASVLFFLFIRGCAGGQNQERAPLSR